MLGKEVVGVVEIEMSKVRGFPIEMVSVSHKVTALRWRLPRPVCLGAHPLKCIAIHIPCTLVELCNIICQLQVFHGRTGRRVVELCSI